MWSKEILQVDEYVKTQREWYDLLSEWLVSKEIDEGTRYIKIKSCLVFIKYYNDEIEKILNSIKGETNENK